MCSAHDVLTAATLGTNVIAEKTVGAAAKQVKKAVTPQMPQMPTAPKAPSTQQAKLPDQGMRDANSARLRAQQLAGVNAGLPSTLLTGSSGISTGSLNLGRSSLLG